MFKAKGRLSSGKSYMGIVRTAPHLCVLYAGICLTTEEKARRNLSQGSRKVPVGAIQCVVMVAFVGNQDKLSIPISLLWWTRDNGNLFSEISELHLKEPVLTAQ